MPPGPGPVPGPRTAAACSVGRRGRGLAARKARVDLWLSQRDSLRASDWELPMHLRQCVPPGPGDDAQADMPFRITRGRDSTPGPAGGPPAARPAHVRCRGPSLHSGSRHLASSEVVLSLIYHIFKCCIAVWVKCCIAVWVIFSSFSLGKTCIRCFSACLGLLCCAPQDFSYRLRMRLLLLEASSEVSLKTLRWTFPNM